jgi:hypothetical protein
MPTARALFATQFGANAGAIARYQCISISHHKDIKSVPEYALWQQLRFNERKAA